MVPVQLSDVVLAFDEVKPSSGRADAAVADKHLIVAGLVPPLVLGKLGRGELHCLVDAGRIGEIVVVEGLIEMVGPSVTV